MLRKVEIGLTVVSILLGTYEILGRTDVIGGRTPIEAVGDVVTGGGSTPRPPEQLQDLTVALGRCEVLQSAFFDVAATSSRPISTFDGVQVTATSGTMTDATTVFFDNSTRSSDWTLSLSLPPGMNEVTIEVDPDDRYEESDEANNVMLVAVDVPEDPLAGEGRCTPSNP